MKNQQQQTARELYFNSNLSKTEIAERLNVSRRTIYQWSVDGDWQKLRESARHMPAILAEKCSYILGHFADSILSAESSDMVITKTEVDMLHKLTITLHKLKKGSTVADNMETFNYLLERIHRKDPALAQQVTPHIEEYIVARRGKDESSFMLAGFDETGHLPYSEKEYEEHLLDQKEAAAILAEQQAKQTAAPTEPSARKPVHPNAPTQTAPSMPHAMPHPTQTQTSSSQANHPKPHTHYVKPRPVHTPLHACGNSKQNANPQHSNVLASAA